MVKFKSLLSIQKMRKENIKKTKAEKEELRLCAVKMIVKGGASKKEVEKILGVHYTSLVERHNLYKKL
jgi:transposase